MTGAAFRDGVNRHGAALLVQTGIARPAPCFHRSRVNPPDGTGPEELAHRLDTSCRMIRAGLPRRIRQSLAAPPPLIPATAPRAGCQPRCRGVPRAP